MIGKNVTLHDLINLAMAKDKKDYNTLKPFITEKVEKLINHFNSIVKIYVNSNGELSAAIPSKYQCPFIIDLSTEPDGISQEEPHGTQVRIDKSNIIGFLKKVSTSVENTINLIKDQLQELQDENETKIWEKYLTDFNNIKNEIPTLNGGKKPCYIYKGTRYTKIHTVNRKKCIYAKKEDTYVPISAKSVKKV